MARGKMAKRFGAEKTLQLLEWNNTPPKTFARVNTLKTDAANSSKNGARKMWITISSGGSDC
jgi:16S rRNA C967 or C1407 C5-methylase (RsmB/RsmF family)